jgi:hypothetical protein
MIAAHKNAYFNREQASQAQACVGEGAWTSDSQLKLMSFVASRSAGTGTSQKANATQTLLHPHNYVSNGLAKYVQNAAATPNAILGTFAEYFVRLDLRWPSEKTCAALLGLYLCLTQSADTYSDTQKYDLLQQLKAAIKMAAKRIVSRGGEHIWEYPERPSASMLVSYYGEGDSAPATMIIDYNNLYKVTASIKLRKPKQSAQGLITMESLQALLANVQRPVQFHNVLPPQAPHYQGQLFQRICSSGQTNLQIQFGLTSKPVPRSPMRRKLKWRESASLAWQRRRPMLHQLSATRSRPRPPSPPRPPRPWRHL